MLLMLLIFFLSFVVFVYNIFYGNLSGNLCLLCDVVYFSFTILDIHQVPVLLPSAQISLTGRIQSVTHFSLTFAIYFLKLFIMFYSLPT